ncbi:lymphocyte antigen 75-like [Mercenaria mercenaria]|uniref:lymphocyte antigen 75-like n=1 Tax=Mercenaria mercenaria TaxID=6596 RepID=UPI00234EE094|nr:lymphocyte antigen 75-like [Mercenaria mercenaria]
MFSCISSVTNICYLLVFRGMTGTMSHLSRGTLITVILCFVSSYAGDPGCGPDWQIVGDKYCYRVSNVRMSWYNADKECKKMDSTLVRLYDQSMMSDVQSITKNSQDTRWWTDLNDLADPNVWVYDRGSYAVSADISIIHWIHEPDDTQHLQNCGALNIQGSVSDERCGDKKGYICEYLNNAGGSCLDGWFNYSTGCYHFPSGLEDPFNMLTWNDAKQKCSTLLKGTTAASQLSHLLYIESQNELQYIRHQLPLISLTSQSWWIGLTDKQTEGQYKWIDGNAVDKSLVFWAEEPNNLGGQEKCVFTNSNGSLADLNCTNKESYICMKENDMSKNVLLGLGCPSAWTRAGQFCYLIETYQKKTWSDAQGACGQAGSSLIKIDSLDKKTWIETQNSIFESGLWFWTGLNFQSNTWHWADGSSADLNLVKWNMEPNNYKGNEACAVAIKSGTFNDVSCLIKAGFICELNTEDAPCPTGWISRNAGDQTNCYYFSKTMATFDEAHSKCNQLSFPRTSYLMAFGGLSELNWTLAQLQKQTSNITEWYTGLTDEGHEGFWGFDTSWNAPPPSGIIPWTTMPKFVNGNENCVVIIFGAVYINTVCSDKRPYICERPAYGVSSSAGSKVFLSKYSVSSVFILGMYFVVYALILHYLLHLTYVLFPAFA